MSRIFLDYNATTPVHPAVLEEMLPYLHDIFGNPSSIHWFGQEARQAVDRARQQVADLIGAEPPEIVFTSGGTESINHAIRGTAEMNSGNSRRIVTSLIEHRAVLSTCEFLKSKDFQVIHLPVDEYGAVSPESAADVITDDTALTTIMLANNEVGTIQPVQEIAGIARERGIVMHTDAVQAMGKIPVDVQQLGVDLLSLSGHKVYAPKGIGALYIRRGVKVAPLIYGGHHERTRRAGTENVPAIVGLGKACELARKELDNGITRLAALRDRLEEGILSHIPDVQLNGHPENRLPNTLNVNFSSIEGESLLMNLDLLGIAVSAGSACTSGASEPSHVLTAMGISPEQSQGSIRFSLGLGTTEADVDATVKALIEIVGRLRELSPLSTNPKSGNQPSEE
ncbi:MAG: cysteine desulfurase NifS [Fidelibacterota bacterium]|nr:MAG: cysteine desulfurase NifS [Candidatus Neomarinimicrobiota bacterium]